MRKTGKLKVWFLAVLLFLVLAPDKCVLAKEIVLQDLSGQNVEISQFKGKPVILFFWTTWCPFCRKEMKALNQQAASITADGIVVLGVNVNEPAAKIKNFFKDYDLKFTMLLDKGARLADQYDVLGVPTYVLLDKNGQLIRRIHELPADYKRLFIK